MYYTLDATLYNKLNSYPPNSSLHKVSNLKTCAIEIVAASINASSVATDVRSTVFHIIRRREKKQKNLGFKITII